MTKLSIFINNIRATAGSNSSLLYQFVLSGICIAAFLATDHGASGATLASVTDPSLLHSPTAILLFIGLAWLSRITEKLHPHQMETVYIGSDPETIFADSTVHEKHHHRKPSVVVPQPHQTEWVMADSIYTDLASYHWIADEQSITLQEAVHGGKYVFERKFTLPHELENLVSAELLVLVHRWCRPTVNGHVLERKGGEIDLLTWDLSTYLQSGENHISFEVENNPAVPWLADDPRWQQWNPYGLKYLIRVIHPL